MVLRPAEPEGVCLLNDVRLLLDQDQLVLQLLHVGLHLCTSEDHPRLQLNFLGEILLRNLAFALEHHAVDDRIFNHVDGEDRTIPIDLHIGEKARREERFQRTVHH